MDLAHAVLFSSPDDAPLGTELHALLGCVAGQLEYRLFPDGERYLRLLTPVAERDVIICVAPAAMRPRWTCLTWRVAPSARARAA